MHAFSSPPPLFSSPLSSPVSMASPLVLLTIFLTSSTANAALCRDRCGAIPVRYPLGIDDGCGSPYYRNMLTCADNATLHLRTPSGTYPVSRVDYTDPHLVVADPSMWSCHRPVASVHAAPFALDTSTRFSLSPKNDYLFFDCDNDAVIVEPKPVFCDRFPDRCDSACDSAAYLCRNIPECPAALADNNMTCCSYYPKASASLRLMLRHCDAYTSVYWRAVSEKLPPYDEVPDYGIRVDFEIPVTTRCLQCQDKRRGGGTCGFDVATTEFICRCDDGRNVTTFCTDGKVSKYRVSGGVIAASVVFSISAAIGIGGLMWYIRKMKSTKVTCGVQSNENRFF